ncbi:MAG: M48 family metallopeptidase [Anaerolineales bacterium]|nr:M48 family metallopeptidase [Anaerolineales bacterium]
MKNKDEHWPVEIIRSAKRKKTVSAKLVDGTLIVRAPARMSAAELAPVIENLTKRMQKRSQPVTMSDTQLEQMAQELNQQYFDGNLHWQSIRFVTNQNTRFGSCTPSQGTIRISQRLIKMPKWVLRYVVMHEIAHLREANHSSRFWNLVNRYPLTERARGYLMAVGLENLSTE